jgi:hypothetical protein
LTRVKQNPSKRNVPQGQRCETPPTGADEDGGMLTSRSALILGASIIVGVCAGGLTYLAAVRPAVAVLTAAIFAGSIACAGALRRFSAIIR